MIKLGQQVKDKITGFEGIAVAKTEWLTGCARVYVQPPLDKDGKPRDAMQFDEPMLEVTGPGINEETKAAAEESQHRGGPAPEPRRTM